MLRQISNEILQETVYAAHLFPGLEVFVLPRKGYAKKYASFATRFGSIDSKFQVAGEGDLLEVPDGVAHFLEHKLFEGEKGNVFDEFARLGASANAYTSFNLTNYLFSTTANFPESFELLLDYVQDPYFTPESVEKEKGIIEQEIRMYLDNPGWRIFFHLLECLYQEHPVRKDIAGTVESIQQIDDGVLYKCYRTFYHPSNMAIFAVGDLDPQQVVQQVKDNLDKRDYRELGEIQRIYPREPEGVQEKNLQKKMVVSLPMLSLGFKDREVGVAGSRLFRKEIVTDLLLDILLGKSTGLYYQLYEEGLINDHFGVSYTGEEGYGHVIIGGETPDPGRLYTALLSGIQDSRARGIDPEDFHRQKNKMLGEFLKSFNSLEFIANNFLTYHFKDINFFDYIDVLSQVTLEEVQERLQGLFQEAYHACTVILPEDR